MHLSKNKVKINFLENPLIISYFLKLIILLNVLNKKANSQRHENVNEQLDEAQELIYKLFEHKEKFKNYLLISKSNNQLIEGRPENTYDTSVIKSKTFNNSIIYSKKGIATRSNQQVKSSPIS